MIYLCENCGRPIVENRTCAQRTHRLLRAAQKRQKRERGGLDMRRNKTQIRHRDRKVTSFTAADELALFDYASRDAARRYTRGSIAIQHGLFVTRDDIEADIATLRALLVQEHKCAPCT